MTVSRANITFRTFALESPGISGLYQTYDITSLLSSFSSLSIT